MILETPLYYSVSNGFITLTQYFYLKDKPNLYVYFSKWTPLFIASMFEFANS